MPNAYPLDDVGGSPPNRTPRRRSFMVLAAALLVPAGVFLLAGSPVQADPDDTDARASTFCARTADTWEAAKAAFDADCGVSLADCDRLGTGFICANERLHDGRVPSSTPSPRPAAPSVGASSTEAPKAASVAEPPSAVAVCATAASTWSAARALFDADCEQPFVECDRTVDGYVCASVNMTGGRLPTGATPTTPATAQPATAASPEPVPAPEPRPTPAANATTGGGEPGTVSIEDLVDAVTKKHEVAPIPSVPAHYNFASAGWPNVLSPNNRRFDQPVEAVYTRIKPWNHIDVLDGTPPRNAQVEMGPMYLASFIDGRWIVENFGTPCRGFSNFVAPAIGQRKGDRVDVNPIRCTDAAAFAVPGRYGWGPTVTSEKNGETYLTNLHGWPAHPHQDISGQTVEYSMVWGAVRLSPIEPGLAAELDGDHYQYGVGIDMRNPGQTGIIAAHVQGRRIVVTDEWRVALGHNMSPETIEELCRAGRLPPGLPFEGDCSPDR
ncbi:MAG: hypothetical protein AAF962_06780 [Actinomycetota bacterium]